MSKNLNFEIKKDDRIIHKGIEKWQNLETGEIIEATEVIKKVERTT